MNLAQLGKGKKGRILEIRSSKLKKALSDFGVLPGAEIEVTAIALTGDPIAYSIGELLLTLRKQDAKQIELDLSA